MKLIDFVLCYFVVMLISSCCLVLPLQCPLIISIYFSKQHTRLEYSYSRSRPVHISLIVLNLIKLTEQSEWQRWTTSSWARSFRTTAVAASQRTVNFNLKRNKHTSFTENSLLACLCRYVDKVNIIPHFY